MSFEEVFAMVCTGGETKKNFLIISSSKMFGILGVAMDATTDLFFGLAVTGLVYLGPVVCAVFRSSAMMSQRSGDDDYEENEDENNEHNLKIIDGMFRFLFGHHRENAERYGRLVPIRDVLLAPFFEEFVFRGLLLTVLLGTGFDEGTGTTSGKRRRLDEERGVRQSAFLRFRAHQPLFRAEKSIRLCESLAVCFVPVHLHDCVRRARWYHILAVQSRPRRRVEFTRVHERVRRA